MSYRSHMKILRKGRRLLSLVKSVGRTRRSETLRVLAKPQLKKTKATAIISVVQSHN